MSKERELLNRSRYNLDREYCADLIDEIQELLAQPEQEQEPVAWGYKKRVTYKPEGSEEEEIIPLYTAPQKRKPLSEEQIAFIWSDPDYQTEEDVTRAIEKMHNIGLDDWRWGNE